MKKQPDMFLVGAVLVFAYLGLQLYFGHTEKLAREKYEIEHSISIKNLCGIIFTQDKTKLKNQKLMDICLDQKSEEGPKK